MNVQPSDARGALELLRDAEDVSGPEAFPPELLDRFRGLTRSDGVGYVELDRIRRRFLYASECARSREIGDPPDASRIFWQLKHEDPVCEYNERTDDFAARKISDFLTRRQLHRLAYYNEYMRWYGTEDQLCVGLPAPLSHTKVFVFASSTRDFGERERSLLDLLRPHLVHLYEAAKARRLAAAIAAGGDSSAEIVVLDRRERIELATARARALLDRYTDDAAGTALPGLVEAWLRQERVRLNGDSLPPPEAPLTVERGTRRLVVRRLSGDPQTLLLSEEPVPGEGVELLTRREREILALVDEGKTNGEIAAALWISPTTVRTHLENVYAKLRVRSRTAALARVRGSN